MKPKFGQVNQGDCVEGMKALAPGTIDLVFADPPFNIGYEYDAYDDRKDHERYLAWSRDWMAEVYRALKPDGTFWLAIGDEYAAELKLIAQNGYPGLPLNQTTASTDTIPAASAARRDQGKSALQDGSQSKSGPGKNGRLTSAKGSTGKGGGFYCRSWVIWYYTFGVHCKNKFTRSHAHLFHFVKDPSNFTFDVDAVRVPSARQLVYGDRRASAGGRTPDDTWIMPPDIAPGDGVNTPPPGFRSSDLVRTATKADGFVLRPQDVPESFEADSDTWYFSRVAGTFKEREGWHGCQMPEQLLGRIIRACSRERDVVLDPFGGSGTTLVVAKKLGREPIGFEMSKQYAAHAGKRLSAVKPGDPLDGAEDALRSAPTTKNGRKLSDRNQNVQKRRERKCDDPAVFFA